MQATKQSIMQFAMCAGVLPRREYLEAELKRVPVFPVGGLQHTIDVVKDDLRDVRETAKEVGARVQGSGLTCGRRPSLCLPAPLPASLPACLHPPTCLPSCLPALPPACLPSCLPALLPACTPTCLPACTPACLPALPPACLPSCLPACPPACLPACPPACCLPGFHCRVFPGSGCQCVRVCAHPL